MIYYEYLLTSVWADVQFQWRRRHQSFPRPTSISCSPQVWLQRNSTLHCVWGGTELSHLQVIGRY